MYRIDNLDNGFLLVNLAGVGINFGCIYFPTMRELTEFLLKDEKTDPSVNLDNEGCMG